jgi:cytochrome c oxidase subunit 3
MIMTVDRRPSLSEAATQHSQFSDADQQRETARIGMWIFLATEVMFFAALFTAYSVFFHLNHDGFISASRHNDFWLGSLNTAVLLTSSLTMALAVHAARAGDKGSLLRYLFITMCLGAAFLVIKGVEYDHHFRDHLFPAAGFLYDPAYARSAQMFFYLYFTMTALHGIHMLGGIGVLAVLAELTRRGKFTASYNTPVELAGLYWHFVDVIWIFLFPMLYLLGGHP